MSDPSHRFDTYALSDRYDRSEGRVFLTGTQALVRIMLDQARRDRAVGRRTAGFVSGYRGSPLGGLDLELWRARARTQAADITFMPAVNEDLGATAVLGAQQAVLDPNCTHEGIFSMWYGKGPGVDRSGDALKHGNAYGSSPLGGVLVVAGDDHGCVSSSMPHQSDVAFMAWFMPTLNPASVAEYLEFGAWGIALSRFSGTWVGFKAISETVESGASVILPPDPMFAQPDYTAPPGGLHIRPSDLPSPEIEVRIGDKLDAVQAFAAANPIDRRIYDVPRARFGFVTTGKAHLDTMEALRLLGLDAATCRARGIDIYKVGMVWPLALRDARGFVRGKREVMVIEEKRGIIESQFKEAFYDLPRDIPERMVGKHDETGAALVPWTGELSPKLLAPLIARRLHPFVPDLDLPARAQALQIPPKLLNVTGATRTPYFCSGCPHNTSTKVPEGSKAASGIGCHVMASWMDRETGGYAQMGGEGVPWVAASKFNGGKHIFQNLGEGTWYHSGSLAIRQAVAAGTNITYKVLYNDAVAMTGGQPVDGPVSVAAIAWSSRAEGVDRIALVSDDIGKFERGDFPPCTSFHGREALDAVQRELREIPGVTVLIYEQACATEKRRRRKRSSLPPVKSFAVINPEVCEGCGDCSIESNCLSVEPLETPLGRKRRINQSTCNADMSCLKGFCPSFVTVEGAMRKAPEPALFDVAAALQDVPHPDLPGLDAPYDLLVTGVGGTGVVTVGALVTMAAHLEGRGASVLDFTGFAQKFGTVLSYIRLGRDPDALHQVRIEAAAADAVIGCDVVVSSAPKASAHYHSGTRMVLNRAEMPTGDLVLHRDASLRVDAREAAIAEVIGAGNLWAVDANALAERYLGDSVFANVMLLGAAWQKGLVPVSDAALKQAIALNGVAVEQNARAFDLGRIWAHDPSVLAPVDGPQVPETAEEIVAHRAGLLVAYQDAAYAARYRDTLAQYTRGFSEADRSLAARALYKLMAYKDEYEVARLHAESGFYDSLARQFDGDFAVRHHLAPPLVSWRNDARGRPVKRAFGPWIQGAMRVLARGKWLRGTWADPFGYMVERREERALVAWYVAGLEQLSHGVKDAGAATAFLAAPLEFRGFGPVKAEAVARLKPQADAALERASSR
ncbi:indolepyruvate ferredoxin oxidoreductase family protein [Tateyamaria omphalii]|uniref:Pyruvate ferredoxin oxidoreductase n=1 Tax=Tateyamaria omphalii TaxID=299262 RepID=A0A1P8MZS6_9RHOB|nr:indolepyruvate ferredoxin oxidoreductase family protein [Tateyamaria omphalii]APX13600.1 pyruvate ferredoxin oxidoreductase [Tateyamaria omphalii]